MTWFNILFFSVFAILFLKSFISWIIGDVDVDVDFDGDTDIDVSGMLSFKGMLHFLLGFSSVLTAVGYENTHSLAIPYTFSLSTYIFAVCVGIIMMVMLFQRLTLRTSLARPFHSLVTAGTRICLVLTLGMVRFAWSGHPTQLLTLCSVLTSAITAAMVSRRVRALPSQRILISL